MKKAVVIIFLLAVADSVFAQQQINMADVQAKLKAAQHMMDSIKNAHPEIQQNIDKYKKLQPGLQSKIDSISNANPGMMGNTKLPDAADVMPKMPDFDKLSNTIAPSVEALTKMQTEFKSSNRNGLPQKSSSFTATSTNETEILAWAKTMYENAKIKAGITFTPMLEKTYNDSSLNAASEGMVMIATGLPKCMGQYLVCKYLMAHPKNTAALNDLGVFMRIDKDYTKAVAVFLYAKSINDSSLEITTNLAWAYSYAGNFIEAKKYFNKVLAIDPKCGSAVEGLSLIAYQEGDMTTFWNSLTQQLLSNAKTGGLGMDMPSNQMASFYDAVLTQGELDKMNGTGNGSAGSNAFDGMPQPDSDDQSTESNIPGDDDIDYPSYKDDFPDDMENLDVQHCMTAQTKYQQARQKDLDYITSLLATLPKPQQFINSDGELETLYDYSKDAHYKFFYKIHQQFGKRSSAIFGESRDKVMKLMSGTMASWVGEFNAYSAAMMRCTDDECKRGVMCEYLPRLASILKVFGMSVGGIVTNGLDKLDDETGWYLNASSPMLQYISEPNWNKYLNGIREVDIRSLKLNLMTLYQNAMQLAAGYVAIAKTIKVQVSCRTELRIMPQKIESKYRDLKTLAPPCYDYDENKTYNPNNKLNPRQTKFDLGPLHYLSDCNRDRLTIDEAKYGGSTSLGPIKAGAEVTESRFWEKVRSKFVEDDYTRTGTELHVKAQMGVGKSDTKEIGDLNITGSAGASATAEATVDFYKQFDQNGTLTRQGMVFDAVAKVNEKSGLSGNLMGIDESKTDIASQSFQKGIEASGEIWVRVGPDGQLGNYNYSNMKANTIGK